ncbi:GyrI-like domain-containing protein [Cytophagaceae bacterium DM2B3-1]|uniref:GyrI-like domain-containing protein n=1 Tax=Xanthocytophaga flava TaxID=3048013 RepID=A0ABT7CW14_9BACT|nr:GyrI-like domain-containing protein [Xanthocytophaga flavus]MDJ1497973.1 GyrI-like domain-containing protein [Xanthocytophaga flavus]
MEKTDLTKEDKAYYSAGLLPELVKIPQKNFLAIEGKGDPSSTHYAEHLQALYSVAYGIKFHTKKQQKDFVVPKLESLLWFDTAKYSGMDAAQTPVMVPRVEWQWKLLIQLPGFVTENDIDTVKEAVWQKKKTSLVKQVVGFQYEEGTVVQILHVGPFSDEPRSLEKIMAFAVEHNLQKAGEHHEIYLSDFRKTLPEKLKTILREPVKIP